MITDNNTESVCTYVHVLCCYLCPSTTECYSISGVGVKGPHVFLFVHVAGGASHRPPLMIPRYDTRTTDDETCSV